MAESAEKSDWHENQCGTSLPIWLKKSKRWYRVIFPILLCVCGTYALAEEPAEPAAATEPTEDAADGAESTDDAAMGNAGEWAARQKAAGLSRAHLDPDASQQSVLFDELNDREKIWLDSPVDDGKFLGVGIKEASETKLGAVVIIPDYGQHAQWPVLVRPLSQTLPDKGWYVFSVSMPSRDFDTPPERELQAKTVEQIIIQPDATEGEGEVSPSEEGETDTEKPATEDVSEDAAAAEEPSSDAPADEPEVADSAPNTEGSVEIDLGEGELGVDAGADSDDKDSASFSAPASEVAGSRVFASINFVKSQGYESIVLVGVGAGANHVLGYLEANKGSLPGRGFAVILVDPSFEEDGYSVFEKSVDEGFSLPFLEIVNSLDRLAVEKAKPRKRVAKVIRMTRYQQTKLALTRPSLLEPYSNVMQRIAGWLSVNVAGQNTKNNRR